MYPMTLKRKYMNLCVCPVSQAVMETMKKSETFIGVAESIHPIVSTLEDIWGIGNAGELQSDSLSHSGPELEAQDKSLEVWS